MELSNLFSIANRIESAGYSYYSKLADSSEGDRRKLYQDLARQEREHRETFDKISENYKSQQAGGRTWETEEVRSQLKAFAEQSIFPNLEIDEVPQDYKIAVRKAVDVEKDSIIFYRDVSNLIKEKDVLDEIIHEERKHLHSLLTELNTASAE